MGNDQLLPSYNIQTGVCDEYIAVLDVQQFTSDMDCFVPLMENSIRLMDFIPNIRLPMQVMGATIIICTANKRKQIRQN